MNRDGRGTSIHNKLHQCGENGQKSCPGEGNWQTSADEFIKFAYCLWMGKPSENTKKAISTRFCEDWKNTYPTDPPLSEGGCPKDLSRDARYTCHTGPPWLEKYLLTSAPQPAATASSVASAFSVASAKSVASEPIAGPSRQVDPEIVGLASEFGDKLKFSSERYRDLAEHLQKHQYRGFGESPRAHIPGGLVPRCDEYIKALPAHSTKNGLKALFVISFEHRSCNGEMVEGYFSVRETKKEDFEPILQAEVDSMHVDKKRRPPTASERNKKQLNLIYHDWVTFL